MRSFSPKFHRVANWAGYVLICVASSIGASAGTETVLYTFTGTPDGSAPYSGLVRDKKGNLYGMTGGGGTTGLGCVYELSPASGGGWTETVLHSFSSNGVDGYSPGGGLTIDSKGNLYGTTIFGGTHVLGTVFELSPSPGGEWTETILYNFTGGTDGGSPQYGNPVFDKKGNLYAAAQQGGTYGYGVAFELSPSSSGEWTETVLHNFADNATDGGYPIAVVFDAKGNLYGTTAQGGSGRGTAFELSPSPDGGWTETIIHNFADDSTDGGVPLAGVVRRGSDLYGTTEHGGSYSLGTVYRLYETKAGWKEQILHNFASSSTDGVSPESPVVFDKKGNLYGTTYSGGNQDYGTVFELTKSKSEWSETILYNFTGESDGGYLYFGVILDDEGNLYGTTAGGGDGTSGPGSGNGVVFEITP